MLLLLFALLSCFCAGECAGAFRVSAIFGSHMVLQRDVPAPVWGFAAAGARVNMSVDGVPYPAATANAAGIWTHTIRPTQAGGPHTISFACSDGGKASLTDVLFGDVLFCSGQSNMDMPVSYAFNSSREIPAALALSSIRFFSIQANRSDVPLDDVIHVAQPWSLPTTSVVGAYSAICYFTGRDIFFGLGGTVPVGLVHSALGGTPIQAWSSAAAATLCPAVKNNFPESCLFNAMINPFTVGPLAVKLFVWYQGEQNVGQAAYYACALPALIADWRLRFAAGRNASALVFLVAQLHPWIDASSEALAEMRDAQLSALRQPATGVVPALDGGDPLASAGSVHPRSKQLPSARLAAAALALSYGHDVTYKAPSYAGATVSQSGSVAQVTVRFDAETVAGGLHYVAPSPSSNSSRCPTDLTVPLDQCAWFSIMASTAAFPNGSWVNASVALGADPHSLVLSATLPPGTRAAATRYGWGSWPVANWYSAAGLPLLPWQAPV